MTHMDMKIESATVVRGQWGPDVCFLYTTLPDPEWPFMGHLVLKFNAARDSGSEYILKHFGIEAQLVG